MLVLLLACFFIVRLLLELLCFGDLVGFGICCFVVLGCLGCFGFALAGGCVFCLVLLIAPIDLVLLVLIWLFLVW